jgi:S-adenosylmethionine:tRNA ribosyltransferase-isomerase
MQPEPPGRSAALLAIHGRIPLPPYIRKGIANEEDRVRYQTVYAQSDGSVAAPTAGLHFTQNVFDQLRERGVEWRHVTLHVGLGTFEPIRVNDLAQHVMHREWAEVPAETVNAIYQCKRRGGRVIAVGTTATRAIESAIQDGEFGVWAGETDLFIRPPYQFQMIDGLITNFHLPRTTLLLLVAAFAGVELLKRAYESAITEKYRFYSYGDAMLIQ